MRVPNPPRSEERKKGGYWEGRRRNGSGKDVLLHGGGKL